MALLEHASGQGKELAIEAALRGVEWACVADVFGELTIAAATSGSVRSAMRYAERWTAVLDSHYPEDDPIFVRPLAALCAANVRLNNLPKARRAFDRLRLIRAVDPGDRAVIHAAAVVLLAAEGRPEEAEAEMRATIVERSSTGGFSPKDEAWAFHQLGRLYVQEGRYDEAKLVVARAMALIAAAPDSIPFDRVKMLEFAAVIDARRGHWREAEAKLTRAVAIADAAPELDTIVLRELLFCYAAVLHKVGRGREARGVEKRLASLPGEPADALVDLDQLKRGERAR